MERHDCGVCEKPIDMVKTDWITVTVGIYPGVSTEMTICEYHSKGFLQEGHVILKSGYMDYLEKWQKL